MVPVIHVLSLLVFSKLFAGFLVHHLWKVFLLERQPCRPIWCNVQRMVWVWTGWPPPPPPFNLCSNAGSTHTSISQHNLRIWRWAHALKFFGRPWRGLFWVEPFLLNHCMVLAPRCSSVSGSWQSSYSLCHLHVEQQFFFFFRSSESSLPWGAMLNFQWPVWESESNTNKWNDTWERKWLIGPICTFSVRGLLTFVASGLDINGCLLSYFEGTANLLCYTSCTLTTLHCSKVSFLCVVTWKDIKYLKNVRGVLSSVRYCICVCMCIYIYIYIYIY